MCSKLKKQEASAGSDKLVLLWRVVKASSGKLNTPDLLLCLDRVGKVEKFRYFQHNSDHPSIVRQFWEWNAYMKLLLVLASLSEKTRLAGQAFFDC